MFKEDGFICGLSLVRMRTCGAVTAVEVVGVSVSPGLLSYLFLTQLWFVVAGWRHSGVLICDTLVLRKTWKAFESVPFR